MNDGQTVLFRLIEGIGLFLPARLFNDGQGILPAQLIGTLTQKTQVCFVIVIVLSVLKGNRVDNKVVVQALGI